ncbi:MAG: hypothetical protein Q9157_006333 [Trypethelium eluteriae]
MAEVSWYKGREHLGQYRSVSEGSSLLYPLESNREDDNSNQLVRGMLVAEAQSRYSASAVEVDHSDELNLRRAAEFDCKASSRITMFATSSSGKD